MKKGIRKNVVYKRVMVFATLFLFVAGALTPVIKKVNATDDFDWAWSSGSGTTGDLYRTGNVSIGSSTSPAKLYVEDGAVLFNGSTGSIPVSGSGSRLMWIPVLKAFRAGFVSGSQWNSGLVGWYSVAMGKDTIAKRDGAVAMGYGARALEYHAVAMGLNTTANGRESFAMGDHTTANGHNSVALGYYTTAWGGTSTALGSFTNASGGASTAMGYDTTASGQYSTAMGYKANASGGYSTAMGYHANASDGHAMALGGRTNASGVASTATGWHTTASGDYSTAMGYYTTASGSYGATALGAWTTASAIWGSTAMGVHTTASRMASTAMGESTTASGRSSTAMGYNTTASAKYATAMGNSTTASGNTTTAMGRAITVSGENSVGIGLNSTAYIVSDSNVLSVMGGKLGLGTVSPDAKLEVEGGAVLFNGSTGDTPVSGAGRRLMWIPSKYAFRAGYVNGNQWDDANIGSGSVAIGASVTASGLTATAMGYGTTASGNYGATATGAYTTASGDQGATAMGYFTTASGDQGATAMGAYTTASGHYGATAMGYYSTASGYVSTAIGQWATANGHISTAIGNTITVDGNYSLGIGLNTTFYTVADDNVMSIMGGNVGIGTVSPDANYSMEIQGNPKGLYVKTADNTYQSIVGQCHHQYRPAGFVLENRYPASASFPKGVMMRFKGMDTNGVMQEYLAFIAEYVTRTAGAIDGDCWIRPVKNGGANWAFRFTHDGKLLIKDGGSASDVPESALHVVGAINLDPIPAPSAPTTGFIIYCDQADGDLKAKSDTGIVTTIATD